MTRASKSDDWNRPYGVRWEAKRHTALDCFIVVEHRSGSGESKAVSPLRSATALQSFAMAAASNRQAYGVRWEAKRHTALDRFIVVERRSGCGESKAVAPLRSATALQGHAASRFHFNFCEL